ncbi:ATP-dependent DNA helicase [Trichonephila clavipes]|nr:ATP-dependent DNA helicase [Trichonephila clavipes]
MPQLYSWVDNAVILAPDEGCVETSWKSAGGTDADTAIGNAGVQMLVKLLELEKRWDCQVIYSQFGLAIHQNDHQARRRFVEWAQNEIAVVHDFHKRILFSDDEAHFWLNGYVNKQNCRIWSEANPQVYVKTPLHPEKLTVWCALWAGGIIGPYFFKNDESHNVTVNGDWYRAMITNFFIPELNNHDVQELWFQQDGATCHTARATIDLLKDTFGDRLISRFGPVNWPPRSCDLTPLDYFLWGYVKSLVYADKPQTLDHLEDNIRRVIADIRPQMLEKVIENWTSRLDYIRASHGSHMPEIIFKIKMPRLRGRARNIGRRTQNAQLVHDRRLNRTAEEHSMDNVNLRHQVASTRANEISEQRDQRLRANTLRQREACQRATNAHIELNQQRMQNHRALTQASFNRLAFEYDPEIDYSSHALIIIGNTDKECQHCHAFKYKGELAGLCCASGKVSLPPSNPPPEPLKTLLAGATSQSKLFLRKFRKFSSCFQMTSFGATEIVHNEDGYNFESTFKIQGQVLQNDNYTIVIKADKVPYGEHAGTYNVPTINEVAVVMTGDPTERRNICVQRRDKTVQTIQDNHRSFDALQYRLIFWEGEDGFHLNIKLRNSTTGEELIKKVSAMNFYVYRLMIRANEDNNILRYRQLFHQYIVDMYAKIESERLRCIKFNQAKLRSEEYIHLRDAIIGNVDATNDINNIGTAYILPSSYSASPRHMHEYIQDAMTYVREYGLRDLFITFTCNPNWDEIKNSLFSGQTSMHRHDITARVFKQKLKSLINLIIHHLVFGETSCWLYSVEWQKRGLPHAHILIWLVAKVRPKEIGKIISAEIPDPNVDQELFAIVTTNMIHGPCGTLNMMSPCMDNGKCTKRFPKPCQTDTITNIDGYPSYRRRDVDNGGQSYELRLSNGVRVDIDNRWVVPYSPLLCKTYKAHINVELCSSVKSIKYICKYVHKGSDKAIFVVQNVNNNDEITRYQMGRYICSNKAIWRIFSFPVHERDPAVIHLAVHLENGQRVYFTEQTALQQALTAPKTTLTEFFNFCNRQDLFGRFAKTLIYTYVPKYFTWNKQSKKWEPRRREAFQSQDSPAYLWQIL